MCWSVSYVEGVVEYKVGNARDTQRTLEHNQSLTAGKLLQECL